MKTGRFLHQLLRNLEFLMFFLLATTKNVNIQSMTLFFLSKYTTDYSDLFYSVKESRKTQLWNLELSVQPGNSAPPFDHWATHAPLCDSVEGYLPTNDIIYYAYHWPVEAT